MGRAFYPPPPPLSLSLSSLAWDPKLAWSRSAAERCTFRWKGVDLHRVVQAVDTDTVRAMCRCLSRHWFLTFCTPNYFQLCTHQWMCTSSYTQAFPFFLLLSWVCLYWFSCVQRRRPIALTSCVARTMEKVLNARILEYLQKNSLLYEHQSGFQRNHSTISQLCFLAHQWTTALDGGKNVQSVFLDLSKAYDRVSIPGLLSKLSLIGFSSSATEWLASFLTHREQCVLLDGTTSAPLTPKSGIPQGTVLGPVLFLIFINDLPESTQSQCSIFADDTTLHTADKSNISSCARLSSDLHTAASWAERWGMLFSAPKSKHLAIGRTAKQSPLVRMNGIPIPQVRTHKHLGLIFNNTLTWNDHVSNVYSTCARMLGILRRLDGNISPPCMERIYKTAIRSRMEYACAVWSGGSTRSLQRLQDSFAKRLGLTLPPLKNRFNYHTLVLFYKIRQNLAPKYLCSLVPDLSSTTSGYSFRKFSYPVPLTKKSATLESFYPELLSYGMTFPLTSNLPRH